MQKTTDFLKYDVRFMFVMGFFTIEHEAMIEVGNTGCLQNLGTFCGWLELFVDSTVSYLLHLLFSCVHMVGSLLQMLGLN